MNPVLEKGSIINAAILSCDQVVRKVVQCPACGSYRFAEWPFGWDEHAKNCSALESESHEFRKVEFKATFRHLFR